MSKKDLKKECKNKAITKKEKRFFMKAQKNIKVLPINSNLILTGVERQHNNDAGRDTSNFILRWLAKRPFLTAGFVIVCKMLSGGKFEFDTTMFYGMIMDTLSVILAAFVGYGAGEEAVRDHNNKIKGRILFINGFFETNK